MKQNPEEFSSARCAMQPTRRKPGARSGSTFAMRHLRAFGFWLVILAWAFLNGGFHELVLTPWLGSSWAPLASGLLLSLFIFMTAHVAVPRLSPTHSGQLLAVGFMWLLLTLCFEFVFGRIIQGKSWTALLHAYAFEGGNVWPLALLVVLLGPLLAARLRGCE
ncbi:conserved membrane hypothetical protein [Thiomonas sp. X19]|uniref:hypothetical protein n=1 Tax=Thiomonas sp. X19 TaxID=1050370 RepID=UPI000B6F70E4|nr:hypothetical protein [Thiomonas sp. X19]SCC95789.1 conserved membrane hypothetical protein [Thiomonas sp. X19]